MQQEFDSAITSLSKVEFLVPLDLSVKSCAQK